MAQRIGSDSSLNGNSGNETTVVTHSNVTVDVENEETVTRATHKKKRSSPRIANLVSLFDVGHTKRNKKQNEEKQQDPDPVKEKDHAPPTEQKTSSFSRFRLLSFGKSMPRQDAIDNSEPARKMKDCPKKHTLDGFQHLSITAETEDTNQSISQSTPNTCKNRRLSPLPEFESINVTSANNSPHRIDEISPGEDTSLQDGSNNNNTQWVGISKRFTEQDSLIKELYLKMSNCESKTDALLEENKNLSQELREVKRQLQCVKFTITPSQDESTNSDILQEEVSMSTAKDKSDNLQNFHRKSLTFDTLPKPHNDELQVHKKMIRKADSQDC